MRVRLPYLRRGRDELSKEAIKQMLHEARENSERSYPKFDERLVHDDRGLHRMTQQQSIDLYELVIARHRTASFVITSRT